MSSIFFFNIWVIITFDLVGQNKNNETEKLALILCKNKFREKLGTSLPENLAKI